MPGTTLVPSPDPGVPVHWSPEVGQRVLDLVASGVPLYKVEGHAGMPNAWTLYEWRERHPEWAAALARARAVQADRLAYGGLEIVDGCDGSSSSEVSKAREQGAYRQWLSGALNPDVYGSKSAGVTINLGTKIELGAILPDRPTQPDRELVVDAKVEPKPEG